MPKGEDVRPFQIRVSDEWLAAVDDWRRRQKKIPPTAEAIRVLVIKGIAADKSPKR